MSLYSRIITPSDIEEVLNFEDQLMEKQIPDEAERMFARWNSKVRKEALEHHFNLGWSFLVRDTTQKSSWSDEGLLVGYFMAQPLLFFDGQTQSLWIEHINAESDELFFYLADLSYRLSREKNFQRVYLPKSDQALMLLAPYKIDKWNAEVLYLKTSKAK